ncbi:MAG TPA: hypothetical protein VFY67_20060 [Pyrinomonadaceae bacterium]|nr:hypothetical protein [Pyrinomonadaceae bacterium]
MRKLLVIAALILANLILVVYLGVRRIGVISERPTTPQNLQSISATQLQDDTGKRITLSNLIGHVTAVLFVNPGVASQLDATEKTVSAYKPSDVSFILITPNSQALRAYLPSVTENVSIVQHHYDGLKKIFGVPDCCERRFIFDTEGALKYHDYYVEDLIPRLNLLAKQNLPEFPLALVDSLNSLTTGRLGLVREQTRAGSSKAAIALFSSVSTNCPSGEMVGLVNQYSERRKDIAFLLLLPKQYTRADIENFKANLQISRNLVVETMDGPLAEKWSFLIQTYGENRINGTVLLVNQGALSTALGMSELEQKLSAL